MFAAVSILAIILIGFWVLLLGIGGLRDWRKKKDARTTVLAGLSPAQQQLLYSFEKRRLVTLTYSDGRPVSADFHEALRICEEAGVEEWRLRALCN